MTAKKAATPEVDGKTDTVDPSTVDTAGKTEQQVRDELAGVDATVDETVEPEDTTPPADAYVDEPERPVTMRDVASLNGIGIAPDVSRVREVKAEDVEFMSEGTRSDLDLYGFAIDPATGRKIVKD